MYQLHLGMINCVVHTVERGLHWFVHGFNYRPIEVCIVKLEPKKQM